MLSESELSGAVIAYLGRGKSAVPSLLWRAEDGRFSDAAKREAEDSVRILDAIPTDWNREDWAEADVRVRTVMLSAKPNLDDRALDALLWKFDYDWK
ncbi:hypothetical protein [Frondihabitans australicus]|uniref:Uncharacterized protein n=1 Tax=Frondihabitans australicus TaxID=386892 RepID=A0A495IKS9_9MICO|nr:hypothetical protein [Frondihabitans australicus]RKR76389.1 hypothetical protein C8E83_3562 [Frondihabitans australicus]